MLIRKLIVYLVRKRLGLKNYEGFQFAGQKSELNWYFFGISGELWKIEYFDEEKRRMVESDASLNWILSDDCRKSIRKNGKWWPDFDVEEE